MVPRYTYYITRNQELLGAYGTHSTHNEYCHILLKRHISSSMIFMMCLCDPPTVNLGTHFQKLPAVPGERKCTYCLITTVETHIKASQYPKSEHLTTNF